MKTVVLVSCCILILSVRLNASQDVALIGFEAGFMLGIRPAVQALKEPLRVNPRSSPELTFQERALWRERIVDAIYQSLGQAMSTIERGCDLWLGLRDLSAILDAVPRLALEPRQRPLQGAKARFFVSQQNRNWGEYGLHRWTRMLDEDMPIAPQDSFELGYLRGLSVSMEPLRRAILLGDGTQKINQMKAFWEDRLVTADILRSIIRLNLQDIHDPLLKRQLYFLLEGLRREVLTAKFETAGLADLAISDHRVAREVETRLDMFQRYPVPAFPGCGLFK